jgi:putative transposase
MLETPEANLVAGIQWLHSIYTKRYNACHREWGHLFQGRYKAIPIEPGKGYFSAVATYIHLNPVRMKGYDFAHAQLADFRWSSFPVYFGRELRPEWLNLARVLGELGMADSPAGQRNMRNTWGQG